VGNLGGFVGPNVIGQVKEATGSFTGGLIALSLMLTVGGVLAVSAPHDPRLEKVASIE
jgi:ACS family tartrate transporter-like MFS transporter